MEYVKIFVTVFAILLMVLFINLNHNVNTTTSYVIFPNESTGVDDFWTPDRVLLAGVLIFVAIFVLVYMVFREKGIV